MNLPRRNGLYLVQIIVVAFFLPLEADVLHSRRVLFVFRRIICSPLEESGMTGITFEATRG